MLRHFSLRLTATIAVAALCIPAAATAQTTSKWLLSQRARDGDGSKNGFDCREDSGKRDHFAPLCIFPACRLSCRAT